ncbi:MAG: T9SS type A sorting domain-containing protein [Saprospiraceae bacterium]|nr:T9SS type A sorting domain-containing protein [Saprospiraceae bacterium]MBP7699650.1 T9SS type A sorting domain-containing protein [Saprospiraceae bacterium]
MKKNLFLLLTAILTLVSIQFSFAQLNVRNQIHQKKHKVKQQPILKQPIVSEFCDLANAVSPQQTTRPTKNNSVSTRSANFEVELGMTGYDLQSNGAAYTRLVNKGNGNLSAAWIFSAQENSWTDRGTGYATATNGVWSAAPTARIETERTGFPALLSEGTTDIVIAHKAVVADNVSVAINNGGTWTESSIPSTAPSGLLWFRAARSGNYIHVIGLTSPVANGGVKVNGIDGLLLYFRSSDGGATWDMSDVMLPGVDSTTYNAMNGDSYGIAAQGSTVAIVSFNQWNDTFLAKSDDYGATWERTNIVDFPLVNYVDDAGYTTADIPVDANAPDTLAIQTVDGTGEIVIDEDGLVHVIMGRMYVADTDLTDMNTSFYPGTNGMFYWNETLGENSVLGFDGYFDANGNDTIDIASSTALANYGNAGITSHATMAIKDGKIYVVYSGIMENYLDPNTSKHYRHLFLTQTEDNGETWTEPFDLINPDIIEEIEFIPSIEAMYPSMAKNVDGNLHILYQKDFAAGYFVNTASGQLEASENSMMYIKFPTGSSGTQNIVDANKFNMQISPNPATNNLFVNFELQNNANVLVKINNALGQTVYTEGLGALQTGNYNGNIDVTNFATGMYFVQLQVGNEIAVKKLMKQ